MKIFMPLNYSNQKSFKTGSILFGAVLISMMTSAPTSFAPLALAQSDEETVREDLDLTYHYESLYGSFEIDYPSNWIKNEGLLDGSKIGFYPYEREVFSDTPDAPVVSVHIESLSDSRAGTFGSYIESKIAGIKTSEGFEFLGLDPVHLNNGTAYQLVYGYTKHAEELGVTGYTDFVMSMDDKIYTVSYSGRSDLFFKYEPTMLDMLFSFKIRPTLPEPGEPGHCTKHPFEFGCKPHQWWKAPLDIT